MYSLNVSWLIHPKLPHKLQALGIEVSTGSQGASPIDVGFIDSDGSEEIDGVIDGAGLDVGVTLGSRDGVDDGTSLENDGASVGYDMKQQIGVI